MRLMRRGTVKPYGLHYLAVVSPSLLRGRKRKAKPKELTKEQKEVRETADRLKRAAERNGILGRTSSAGQPTDVPPGSAPRSVAYRPASPAQRACVRAAMRLEQCNVVRRNANKQIKVRPGAAPLRRLPARERS